MNYQITPRFNQNNIIRSRSFRRRMEEEYRFPSVSIFMAFDPKMGNKNKINDTLKNATEKAAFKLRNKFPGEMSAFVLQKLKDMIKNLDHTTHRKSLAIFVSPVFSKIIYFNMPVEERVSVKKSFHIRDLVHGKKELQEFHILSLGEKESRIFLSNTNSLVKIIPANAGPESIIEAKVNYLRKIDHSLVSIIQSAHLPVFVMGNDKMMKEFKKMSQNKEVIVGYVPVGKEGTSLENLTKLLDSQLNNWEKIHKNFLNTCLLEAVNRNESAFGMEKVLKEVIGSKGGLLLLEKDYLYELDQLNVQAIKHELPGSYNRFSCIKNPVDKMIATVLENGGDVEFVPGGFLKKYHQIAFLKKN